MGSRWRIGVRCEKGKPEGGGRVLAALEETLAHGIKTRDLDGSATTEEMTNAMVTRLRSPSA
jgi:isocitrate/isopropylmalate dehydrogenase